MKRSTKLLMAGLKRYTDDIAQAIKKTEPGTSWADFGAIKHRGSGRALRKQLADELRHERSFPAHTGQNKVGREQIIARQRRYPQSARSRRAMFARVQRLKMR